MSSHKFVGVEDVHYEVLYIIVVFPSNRYLISWFGVDAAVAFLRLFQCIIGLLNALHEVGIFHEKTLHFDIAFLVFVVGHMDSDIVEMGENIIYINLSFDGMSRF